jgi:hypothetical protein
MKGTGIVAACWSR